MLEAPGGVAGIFHRFQRLSERGREAWHGVFGIPDYEAYLVHMHATHPGETPLARGEFFAWALERRHAGRGPRCC
jgi:uncharacterized short protein YbdD (DUF466 family)